MSGNKKKSSGIEFLPWLLGFFLSTLAIVRLTQYGIVEHDLVAPLQAIVNAYEERIAWAFRVSGFEDAANWLGRNIAGLFGWKFTLYPHWRDIFILTSIAGLAIARVLAGVGAFGGAALNVIFGIIGALSGSLIAGAVSIGEDTSSDTLIVLAPTAVMFGAIFFAYIAGRFLTGKPRSAAFLFVTNTLVMLTVIKIAFEERIRFPHFLVDLDFKSTGLAALGLVIIVIALGSLAGAFIFQSFIRGHPYLKRVREDELFQLGLIMLNGFIGAALLFSLDAAIKLAG